MGCIRGNGCTPHLVGVGDNRIGKDQSITDITTDKHDGIHFEPGMWLFVPSTTNPNEPVTVARMASIPHGTTIIAQGVATPAVAGPPNIGAAGITPLFGGVNGNPFRFENQTVTNMATRRLPQDLTALSAAGLITQQLIDNPNKMLADRIIGQNITKTIEIRISTNPVLPLPDGPFPTGFVLGAPGFGGGTSNIAFLLGGSGAYARRAELQRQCVPDGCHLLDRDRGL